jgi:methylated-DNA-[protein]-cysteine S-methyltransferase
MIKKTAAQLAEYFDGKRKTFNLPLAPEGTEFQKSVWQALQTIPFGETRSYGEIAAQIGKPQASRAVGMANNRNPIVIIIPCHRVIGHDGNLTGYGGGLKVKEFLLHLEKHEKPS